MRFLNVNSPFMKYLNKLIDYMGVGILWIVFCVPVFTGGAATTAALLTVEISVRKEEGKILATFWKWFRRGLRGIILITPTANTIWLWRKKVPERINAGCGTAIISNRRGSGAKHTRNKVK